MTKSQEQLISAQDRLIEQLRLMLVLLASLLGSFLCLVAEGDLSKNSSSFVAQLLGGAAAPFLVAIFVSSFVRGWAGIVIGIIVVAAFTFFQTSAIRTGKEEQRLRTEPTSEKRY